MLRQFQSQRVPVFLMTKESDSSGQTNYGQIKTPHGIVETWQEVLPKPIMTLHVPFIQQTYLNAILHHLNIHQGNRYVIIAINSRNANN